MRDMTMAELYELLNSKKFQDTEEGDLFYNFFIYQYSAEREYEMREQIIEFKRNLKRPTSYVDVLTIDIFDEFCKFLDGKKFLRHPSMLKYLRDKEDADPENAGSVQDTLSRNAHSKDFINYLHERIMEHKEIKDGLKRPYVFLYGIGAMYPYLRVNELLAMYEDFNISNAYKLLVFYPGKSVENSFSLFGVLPDHHTYRAIRLVNEE